MLEVINELNRNTIAKDNGLASSSDAMNHFCSLIIKNSKNCDLESYRNRLEWISCYENLNEELKKSVEVEKKQIDLTLSDKNLSYNTAKIK
jgi:hypothetical protein